MLPVIRGSALIPRMLGEMRLHERYGLFAEDHSQESDQRDDRRSRGAHAAQSVDDADDTAHHQRNDECIHGKLRADCACRASPARMDR